MMIINVYNYNFAKLEKKIESASENLKKEIKIFCGNDFSVKNVIICRKILPIQIFFILLETINKEYVVSEKHTQKIPCDA